MPGRANRGFPSPAQRGPPVYIISFVVKPHPSCPVRALIKPRIDPANLPTVLRNAKKRPASMAPSFIPLKELPRGFLSISSTFVSSGKSVLDETKKSYEPTSSASLFLTFQLSIEGYIPALLRPQYASDGFFVFVLVSVMAELPKKYKAVVYDEPGKISTKIVELDMPEPGAGEVLINLSHSGVCHSDLGVMTNRWAGLPYPTQAGQVGGHEGVGKVVKMGPGTESSTVKVGDRVGIKWISAICSTCPACLAGYDGVCFNQKVSGYYTPGTFQQYVCGPANYVTPIPESLASDVAAPMLCAGVTVFSALRKSTAEAGDWIVLLGAGGGLGHLACQIASRGMGMRVIGIDAGSKKDLVLASGAEVFIDHTQGTAEDEVKKVTGGLGAKAVLVLTAANGAYAR
nr:alcohol dehydrogenase 2 [Quercus suber]